ASGIIISGQFGDICIREKNNNPIELGELLIAEKNNTKILLHVFDLVYGSQLDQHHLELISGLKLEEDPTLNFMDQPLRSYVLAKAKNLITLRTNKAITCKTLPAFFSDVREVQPDDLKFLTTPQNALTFGQLRSGSKTIPVKVTLDGKEVFSHHILVSGTTGKGKSILMKNLLWETLDKPYCGLLVLDPHDEYYGRTTTGLKDHPSADTKLHYYSPNTPPPGSKLLRIHLSHLKPAHFNGIINWSEPQHEALIAYYRTYGQEWIEAIITGKPLTSVKFAETTIDVLKRRIMQILSISIDDTDAISCNGVFDQHTGQTTTKDIVTELQQAKTIIIDTSTLSGHAELLTGSILANEIFHTNKKIQTKNLHGQPVISIVLEEAPRVLGKDALEKGPNIFATLAREGRKFHVGITAITQLPSLIPREILANMNTKIILGTELKQERQALIESSAQDLSAEDRLIASLDKGEAIITSTFVIFATPISIPNFEETANKSVKQEKYQSSFGGIKLT
ncbi:ATP-binding protein, partial [Candidatus Woesearchaeota archaeon]|nr:ATP-binding protein [Candidatus Woesearchaeota archaeon]